MKRNLLTKTYPVHSWGLGLILGLFVVLGLWYDFTVPLFEKPDELKHFAVVQYIQTRRQLPQVRAGVYQPWDQEGTQPPLYHLAAAVVALGLNQADFTEPPRNPHYADDRSFVWRERGNNNLYLHPPGENWSASGVIVAARLARWVSLLAGLAAIIFTYGLARVIWDYPPPSPQLAESERIRLTTYRGLPLLAAALLAFVPQFLHVSSAITNDSLSVPLAAAGLLLAALVLKNGASAKYAAGLGLVLGLAALTKLSLLYLYPVVALAFLIDFPRHRELGRLLRHGALLVALSALVAGWWYWRNWQLYGDISALSAHLLYRGGALNPRPTLAQLWQTEMTGLELTFWAAFGAGQILITPWIYTALRGLKFVVFAGVAVGTWQLARVCRVAAPPTWGRTPVRVQAIILALLAVWAAIVFGALLRWMQITPASWGRLLFPALPALAVLAAWGLAELALLGQNYVPEKFRFTLPIAPWLAALALLALAAVAPFYYIEAAYAPTPLMTEAAIPANINRLDATFGEEGLRLLGYRVEKNSVQPGQWLPVTLYWQATRPVAKNYSVFVHLLDAAGQSIAQANTYPDGGRWPTSFLTPGLVLPDTNYIFVPATAPAPVFTRLALGIFEFDDPARAAKIARTAAGNPVELIVPGVPLTPAQWPALHPAQPLAANFDNQIQLIGYNWVDQPAHPGQSVRLTLYWQTLAAPQRDLNLFIHLANPDTSAPAAGFDGPPQYPTGVWQPGNTIIDARELALPASLPPGRYNLNIGWYNLTDFGRLPLVQPQPADALRLLTVTVE